MASGAFGTADVPSTVMKYIAQCVGALHDSPSCSGHFSLLFDPYLPIAATWDMRPTHPGPRLHVEPGAAAEAHCHHYNQFHIKEFHRLAAGGAESLSSSLPQPYEMLVGSQQQCQGHL